METILKLQKALIIYYLQQYCELKVFNVFSFTDAKTLRTEVNSFLNMIELIRYRVGIQNSFPQLPKYTLLTSTLCYHFRVSISYK